MAENNDIIKVEDLTIGYGTTIVLKDLNFFVNKSEIFVILGGSGCGKSTLLKHLIGLYPPMKGNIMIKGHSMIEASYEEKQQLMCGFGVTYQGGALFGSRTLLENVMLPLEEFSDLPRKEREDVAREKLRMVDLNGFEDYYPAAISGGMKKRAGLARAMALDPDLLFFDEPSAGLDPISSAELDKLILRLRKEIGATVVIVTHELDSIFSVADRCIMLDKKVKGMVAAGNPHELRKNSDNQWVTDFLNRENMRN